MRNPFENSETFTAHSTIAACGYMIGLELKALESIKSPTGINAAIDAATGHNPFHKHYKSIIQIVDDMLPSFDVLEDEEGKESALKMKKELEGFMKVSPLDSQNISNN